MDGLETALLKLPLDKELHLNGNATDHIWLMADGDEPNVIGIRMDFGDSGTVYVTRDQAKDLAEQLQDMLRLNVRSLLLGEDVKKETRRNVLILYDY